MSAKVWAVSRFQDSLREVTAAKAEQDRTEAAKWGMRPDAEYFATEAQAATYLIERADADVCKAEKALAKAKARSKRVAAKYLTRSV